jgi:concanavalin A-like lectin/glucanase superfamily protein
MKTCIRLLTAALVLGAALPGAAPAIAAPAAPAASAAVMVANYTFDAGPVAGRVAENSGRGLPLTVRSANGGAIRYSAPSKAGRYVAFPAPCAAAAAATCPQVLLEAASDPDLNPGTKAFRWGATMLVPKTQATGANVMQKGVAGTGSQWKMQIGKKAGRPQCVVAGTGLAEHHVVHATSGVADGAWHKVLCLRSGTMLAISIDGVNRGRAVIPANLSITNPKPLRIGGRNFNAPGDAFHGYLDNVYAMLG